MRTRGETPSVIISKDKFLRKFPLVETKNILVKKDRMHDSSIDFSSERWRKPIPSGKNYHRHEIDMTDGDRVMFLGSRSVDDVCLFCAAHFHDRTLEEIVYHLTYPPPSFSLSIDWDNTLISKWENNEDAWGDPIGNNIKG